MLTAECVNIIPFELKTDSNAKKPLVYTLYTKSLICASLVVIPAVMTLLKYQDYRTYLRDELEDRINRNPAYSLRSFAQSLGLSPQMMSFVLNRKKNISLDTAEQIAERLALGPDEAGHFLDLVALAKAKNTEGETVLKKRIQERGATPVYGSIESSKFRIISDWYHYAILELTQTNGFKSDPAWIAKRLGIKNFEVEQALQRLLELELLEQSSKGRITRTELNLTATFDSPNTALRKLAKQYLEKSILALEEQSLDERDMTNITMSIDPSRLPHAKKMIAEFRRKLCAYLEKGDRSEVYVFSPSLFKITKKN